MTKLNELVEWLENNEDEFENGVDFDFVYDKVVSMAKREQAQTKPAPVKEPAAVEVTTGKTCEWAEGYCHLKSSTGKDCPYGKKKYDKDCTGNHKSTPVEAKRDCTTCDLAGGECTKECAFDADPVEAKAAGELVEDGFLKYLSHCLRAAESVDPMSQHASTLRDVFAEYNSSHRPTPVKTDGALVDRGLIEAQVRQWWDLYCEDSRPGCVAKEELFAIVAHDRHSTDKGAL